MHPQEVLRFYDTVSFIDSIFISWKFEFCVLHTLENNVFFLYEYTFLLSSYEVADVIFLLLLF